MKSGPHCKQCSSRHKLMLCSRCRHVYYCCKEHQVKDWKNHKKNCSSAPPSSKSDSIPVVTRNRVSDPLSDLSSLGDEKLFPNRLTDTAMHQKSQTKKKFVKNSDIVLGHSDADARNCHINLSNLKNTNNIAGETMPNTDYPNDKAVDGVGNISYDHLTEVSITAPPFLHKTKREELGIIDEVCRNVIMDMDSYGVCVVDNFLGKERGLEVLEEVKTMHNKGIFEDGQLVSSKGNNDLKTIRSDQIAWIDGKEPTCKNIDMLITEVDKIIMKSNRIENNGKMGDFTINGRTKAMVACYPGDGAHYVKHVDNPNKDGRCITAIYYLNPDWDTEKDGGLLRIFPEGWQDIVADIAPVFDRILFFWSDRRNPHEVQPSFKTRYAITLWYFDAAERKEACKRYASINKRL